MREMVEMENTTCECGKKFHACSSCDFAHGWQYTYCCKECWEQSEDYKESVMHMKIVLTYIQDEHLNDLAHVLDDASGDYYGVFVRMIMDRKDQIKVR